MCRSEAGHHRMGTATAMRRAVMAGFTLEGATSSRICRDDEAFADERCEIRNNAPTGAGAKLPKMRADAAQTTARGKRLRDSRMANRSDAIERVSCSTQSSIPFPPPGAASSANR